MKSKFLHLIISLSLLFNSVTGLVRRGNGVVLVKISSITNPEGRDAAGSCCNGVSESSGLCSGNCFSLLKICASQVKNDSVLLEMYKNYQLQKSPQTPLNDREDANIQSRNPGVQNLQSQTNFHQSSSETERIKIPQPPPGHFRDKEKERLPLPKPKLKPPNNFREPIRIKPLPVQGPKPPPPNSRPRRPPPPPVSKPQLPFGLPNIFRSRSNGPPLSRPESRRRSEPPEMSLWEPDQFTVMWRDGRGGRSMNDGTRDGKMLLGDDVICRT